MCAEGKAPSTPFLHLHLHLQLHLHLCLPFSFMPVLLGPVSTLALAVLQLVVFLISFAIALSKAFTDFTYHWQAVSRMLPGSRMAWW